MGMKKALLLLWLVKDDRNDGCAVLSPCFLLHSAVNMNKENILNTMQPLSRIGL